jgi:hypothetical protein
LSRLSRIGGFDNGLSPLISIEFKGSAILVVLLRMKTGCWGLAIRSRIVYAAIRPWQSKPRTEAYFRGRKRCHKPRVRGCNPDFVN